MITIPPATTARRRPCLQDGPGTHPLWSVHRPLPSRATPTPEGRGRDRRTKSTARVERGAVARLQIVLLERVGPCQGRQQVGQMARERHKYPTHGALRLLRHRYLLMLTPPRAPKKQQSPLVPSRGIEARNGTAFAVGLKTKT